MTDEQSDLRAENERLSEDEVDYFSRNYGNGESAISDAATWGIIARFVLDHHALEAALARSEARCAVLRPWLSWALDQLDRGDGVLEYTGDAADGRAAIAALDTTDEGAEAMMAALRAADDVAAHVSASSFPEVAVLRTALATLRERGILPAASEGDA